VSSPFRRPVEGCGEILNPLFVYAQSTPKPYSFYIRFFAIFPKNHHFPVKNLKNYPVPPKNRTLPAKNKPKNAKNLVFSQSPYSFECIFHTNIEGRFTALLHLHPVEDGALTRAAASAP